MKEDFGAFKLAAEPSVAPLPGLHAAPVRKPTLWEQPALRGTLSLLVPGAGQFAEGRNTLGLFYLSAVGFLAAVSWSLLNTLDRLTGTLTLLGYPPTSVLWALGAAFVGVAAIHLTSSLGAAAPSWAPPIVPHPALPGLASALLPGWGQILNGCRARAGIFLGATWLTIGVWIATSQAATELLNQLMPVPPRWEAVIREPNLVWAAQWTLPAVVWCLAVYDAVTTAIQRR